MNRLIFVLQIVAFLFETVAFSQTPRYSLPPHCLTKAVAKALARREAKEQRLLRKEYLQKKVDLENEASNRKKRIYYAFERIKHPAPLKPSEVREFKIAIKDLKESGRLEEAQTLEKRVLAQEKIFEQKKSKIKSLDQEQIKLITKNVQLTSLAKKQFDGLPKQVAEAVLNKIFLALAQNPKNTGVHYIGGQVVNGIPSNHYKKVKFSFGNEYRLIFRINPDNTVIIEAIGARESVYQGKMRALGGSSG